MKLKAGDKVMLIDIRTGDVMQENLKIVKLFVEKFETIGPQPMAKLDDGRELMLRCLRPYANR